MLEENDYESWNIRMKRYNRSKPQEKAIWKSIVEGPAPYPMTAAVIGMANVVVEALRPKRDKEFTVEENTRDLVDIQVAIILSQGHVARECKEPKRAKDSQYYKDKMMLSDAKDRGVILDAKAEAFLADVECAEPYNDSLVLTTTTTFQVSHEDAYDSDIDDGPHATAAFMGNLSSTKEANDTSSSKINELEGYIMTNKDLSQANESLKAELAQCKLEMQRLEHLPDDLCLELEVPLELEDLDPFYFGSSDVFVSFHVLCLFDPLSDPVEGSGSI
nr:hypothetical protein [Tanacetum cinerariifolium]